MLKVEPGHGVWVDDNDSHPRPAAHAAAPAHPRQDHRGARRRRHPRADDRAGHAPPAHPRAVSPNHIYWRVEAASSSASSPWRRPTSSSSTWTPRTRSTSPPPLERPALVAGYSEEHGKPRPQGPHAGLQRSAPPRFAPALIRQCRWLRATMPDKPCVTVPPAIPSSRTSSGRVPRTNRTCSPRPSCSRGWSCAGNTRSSASWARAGWRRVHRARHRPSARCARSRSWNNRLADDEDFLRRFRNEAVVARRLQHPNARARGRPRHDGGRTALHRHGIRGGPESPRGDPPPGPLSLRRSVVIALPGRGAPWPPRTTSGIVHRDIKPDNILLTGSGEFETAKVLDFGIAKIKESALGDSGAVATRTGHGGGHAAVHVARAGHGAAGQRSGRPRGPVLPWAWCSTRWSPAACPSSPTPRWGSSSTTCRRRRRSRAT